MLAIATHIRFICFKDHKPDQEADSKHCQRNYTNILHHYYPEKPYATIATKQEINLYEILAVKYCLKLNNSAKNVKPHLVYYMDLTAPVSTQHWTNIRIFECLSSVFLSHKLYWSKLTEF